MNSLTTEQKEVFFEKNDSFQKSNKSDLLLKMGLIELVFHALVLFLLV